MKKILIIDSSDLLRQFLKERLEQYNFQVIASKDGFDGLVKLKNELPDLVIMDFFLNKMTGIEVLREKSEFKNIVNIPVLILSSRVDRELITKVAKYKVFKFLTKPVKIDLLLKSGGELFNMKLELDKTPCIIDVHLNDDILFVEIASGLNKEKINILKYKILQITESSKQKIMKILIIFSDIGFSENLGTLLYNLLDNIVNVTKIDLSHIKILSSSEPIKNFLTVHEKFGQIQITSDFVEAIDSFGKIDAFAFGEEIENIKSNIISLKEPLKEETSIVLKFDNEKIKSNLQNRDIDKKYVVSVVDDDFHILEFMATVLSTQENYEVHTYENGKLFIEDLENNTPDLVFLDLMMPEMNGFQVLKYIMDKHLDIPVVVVTALIQKDTIMRAQKFGIKSYLSKPLRVDLIIKKAEEILKATF
ncbi:MAG TPA: response regulator [Spirochaetota bacterium]|nr:response regulator [Spirochaetota bacterium]